jgi:glutathione peroxidase
MKLRPFLLAISMLVSGITAVSAADILTIPLKDISGKESSLGAFKGKTLLVVNVASKCGYTRQYKGLEALYQTFKDKGLVVVGIPCNDFGGQEPGTEEEIVQFCSSKYNVTFPLMGKVAIKGETPHPLFAMLTGSEAGHPGPVKWNFNKFLIGKDGRLLQRFESKVEPESEELKSAIEKALAN